MTLEPAYAASKSRVQRVPKSLIREFALVFLVVPMNYASESVAGFPPVWGRLSFVEIFLESCLKTILRCQI